MKRKPIVTILGHVDHGKTKLLDRIRQTTVVEREAGKITQAIGASIVPIEAIKRISGPLLEKLKLSITISGLLFIDTPGHAAFANLRKRGGNLADIAVLVIDLNEGFKPQTFEAIEILKKYKTPFIVAANKIDLISGWQKKAELLMDNIALQNDKTKQLLETKIYEIVAKLYELGFEADRFDRVSDHTKQVAVIPVCAKSGEGIPEILMVLVGLAQKFLDECLKCDISGNAKGTILEIKEEKGLGMTLDVIIYDGSIKVGDTLIIAGIEAPIVTKVKALLEPMPLNEMRDKKSKFKPVKEVHAATGVKISAPEIEGAVAGMPLRTVKGEKEGEIESIKKELQSEVDEVLIETDEEGLIIKADSLGSLEAMITILRDKNISIRKASIGNIIKKDIADAESNLEKDKMNAVILGFNVVVAKDAGDYNADNKIKIFTNEVIYRLLEDFEAWLAVEKKSAEAKGLENLTRPCKVQLMPNYVFRQSNPAIVGTDVQAGILKVGIQLMNKNGEVITTVKSMKIEKDNVSEAIAPKQLAVAYDRVAVGRQIHEGDILYSALQEEDFRKLKGLKKFLKHEEVELLKEIALIMREKNTLWGV